jgi:pimeloyl-ACP methyl ester carboxylesterase
VKQTLAHRMLKTATLAVTFSAAAGSFAAVASTQAAVPAITWGPCGQELVDNDWTSELGPRLECGSMSALLDDDAPALGSVDVGLVRFKAGDPGRREGSIFFNFGGPGGNPLDFLPATGYLWSTRSADHPLDGDKRRLADRYDLVAVIPRGLRGGTRFSCHYTPGTMSTLDSALYLADWNWAGFVQEGRAYAEACGATSLHAYVGTLQHVRDMERARLALGEPALNFVGTSYGTWVGAFYAAMYPAHTGKVVLDSVMNYAGTFEDQLGNYPAERQALFARHALGPALAAPRIYGIGTNVRDVMARFFGMPHVAREAWASLIRTPGHLVAALTMADWVRTQWDITGDRLIARAQDYRFSPDATVNGRIRNAALDLAANFERGTAGSNEAGELDDDVYIAVLCGDTPWRKDKRALRALANRINADYSAANGTPVTIGLICAHWSSPPRPRPDIANLIKAPPLLLVQAEFDPATPFRGARRALDASPGSHMVLARNAHVHGLVGLSETPCIEHAVGRFLLTGELPDERLTGCDFVPASPARESRDLGNGPDQDNVRAELVRRLRRS